MPTREEKEAHRVIQGGVHTLGQKVDTIARHQLTQLAAQTPIAMLQGIQPPYFYGDEGEDVEAFIYALVNCASANDWKDLKTVNNLAHFLDGRAGYAFRAAVQHRVNRALDSHKQALHTRMAIKAKLAKAKDRMDEASDLLMNLGAKMGAMSMKDEDDGEEKDNEEKKEHLLQLRGQYTATTNLFSQASVEHAQIKSEVEEQGTLHGSVTTPAPGNESSQHAIAFPTLDSALSWLRNTFRREDVEDQLTGDYFGRRQAQGELVQDYALDLLKLHSRAGLVSTEEKQTTHFVEGLRPRFKRTLKHYLQSGKIKATLKDWEAMVRAAGVLEREHPGLKEDETSKQQYRTLNAIDQGAPPLPMPMEAAAAAPPPPTTYQFGELAAIVEAIAGALRPPAGEISGREHNNSTRSKQCYNCHELGHLSWDCPKAPTERTHEYRAKRNNMPRYSPTCFKCNETGHYSNACPNGAAEGSRGKSGEDRRGNGAQQQGAGNAQRGGRNPNTGTTSRGAPYRDNRRQGNGNRA